MATQKNFVVRNGLTVGSVEVIDSSGLITSAALGAANTENIQDVVGAMVVGGSNITATYDDGAGTLTLDADLAGDIEGVTAGAGLTGGGASGELTVNVGAGNGITVNADDIEIDTSVVTDLSTAQTLTNKTLTSPVLNTGVSGTAVLDDDTFGTASATTLASSESIKAYVDAQTTTEIAEGTNLYYTDARADARIAAATTDDLTEGSTNLYYTTARWDTKMAAADTDDLSEGSSNLYFTNERVQDVVGGQLVTNGSHTNITASYDDAGDGAVDLSISDATIRGKVSAGGDLSYNSTTGVMSFTERTDSEVRGLVSATDAGGDGSFSYNSTTGAFTYTGPSASETRAHFSAGTGVTLSSGEISIGQAVSTSSNVQFGNLTLSGDLTVNGTTTTIATTNTVASDTLFELGNGTSGAPANDSGIIIERGSENNAFIGFDESADKFTVGTTTATGASTGDLTITTGTLVANLEGNVTGDVTGNADTATALETARTIGGVSFNGTANINLPGVNTTGNQNTSGNAATATALQTARTIGGVSFDGTANINLPGVNTAGNQDTTGNATTATTASVATSITATANNSTNETTYIAFVDGATGTQGIETDTGLTYNPSTNALTATTFVGALSGNATTSSSTSGNAATATVLQTARTIGGVSFNGSANINLPGVNTTGNQNTSGTAAAWTTARTITLGGDLTGNVSIDGSANATLTATIAANSVALGTDTTGNYVGGIAGTTNEIEVSGSGSENATVTIGLPNNVTISGTSTLTGKATTSFTTIGSSDGALRNTFIHSAAPSAGDGAVGDVWITYA